MLSLEEIFKNLDNYLIKDLESLKTIGKEKSAKDETGGCGIPMLMSLLSGIELLGRIYTGMEKREAFKSILKDFFPNEYSENNNAESIYSGVRNGTAHIFLPTFNLVLSNNGDRSMNLVIDSYERVHIDTTCFYEDFLKNYPKIKDKIMSMENDKRNENLKKLERDFEKNEKHLKNFEAQKIKEKTVVHKVKDVTGTGNIEEKYDPTEKVRQLDGTANFNIRE